MYYTVKKCKKCNREFIVETEEQDKLIKRGHYLVCPFCKHRELKTTGKYDALVQCYINSERG